MPQHGYSFGFGSINSRRLPIWCIPLGYALTAVALGLTLPRIQAWFLPGWTSEISPASAIAIYSSVAAGMITWTGIVFSLVFVMVQFSATAYSPRLVLWMSRDPLVSHAIGVFCATFLYAIAALAWVDRQSNGKVPLLSVLVVVGLLLASVGVFVGLVQSLSRLQIHNVLAFTGDFARRIIDVMYPPLQNPGDLPGADLNLGALRQTLIYHGPPRVIQALDVTALLQLAERAGLVIEMGAAVGDTLVEGCPMMRIYGEQGAIDETRLRKAIRTGTQRTFEQDPKYSIHLIADIAIRALSAAINDPTTAVQALDQIEDLLLRLGHRRLEIGEVRNSAGRLRLLVLMPKWEDFLDLAFSQIRSYGSNSVQVMRRMKALLSDLIDALPEERAKALRHQQARLDKAIARSFPDLEDQEEASEEDREGLGAPRKHRPGARSGGPATNPLRTV
jgi:uncharacterized membrane protein